MRRPVKYPVGFFMPRKTLRGRLVRIFPRAHARKHNDPHSGVFAGRPRFRTAILRRFA